MKNLWALMVLLLAGCAGDATKPDFEAQEESIDQILTQPLAEEEYAKEVRCLATYTYNSVEVLDSRHVVFKGTGGRFWLNRLRNRCLGLRRYDTLKFELRGSQICDLDSFESISISLGAPTRTSAMCSLGTFTPMTEEQLEAVKIALERVEE